MGSLRYGDTKGQLGRGVSLGLPLLSPVTEHQSSRVGDYISKVRTGSNINRTCPVAPNKFPEKCLSRSVFILFFQMQNELERSISNEIKNGECTEATVVIYKISECVGGDVGLWSSATAELESVSTRLSPVGSVSRTDLHPVSMATQQYLEVLKKNNMI